MRGRREGACRRCPQRRWESVEDASCRHVGRMCMAFSNRQILAAGIEKKDEGAGQQTGSRDTYRGRVREDQLRKVLGVLSNFCSIGTESLIFLGAVCKIAKTFGRDTVTGMTSSADRTPRSVLSIAQVHRLMPKLGPVLATHVLPKEARQ